MLTFLFEEDRKIKGIPNTRVKIKEFENSIVYDLGKGVLIQETTNTNFTTNLEIKTGVTTEEIISKFGKPINVIPSNEKYFCIYL